MANFQSKYKWSIANYKGSIHVTVVPQQALLYNCPVYVKSNIHFHLIIFHIAWIIGFVNIDPWVLTYKEVQEELNLLKWPHYLPVLEFCAKRRYSLLGRSWSLRKSDEIAFSSCQDILRSALTYFHYVMFPWWDLAFRYDH